MQYRAVAIGVNGAPRSQLLPALDLAERDAHGVRDVLTDPDTGLWAADQVELLVGERATATQVKQTLRRKVKQTRGNDLLLVYFSGHAFTPPWSRSGDAYLVTHDLALDDLEDEPDLGVRMSFLRDDVFAITRGASVLLLDCCLANDYLTSRTPATSPDAVPGNHAALLAYSPDGTTRETPALRHGEFTSAVLQAFRSIQTGTEPLTVDGLNRYLRQRLSSNPLYDVRNGGVYDPLTRRSRDLPRRDGQPPHDPPVLAEYWESQPPLAPSTAGIQNYIRQILDALPPAGPSDHVGLPYYLEAVRRATGGRRALVITLDRFHLDVEETTDSRDIDALRSPLTELATRAANTGSAALSHLAAVDDRSEFIYAVPLHHPDERTVRMLVVIGDEPPAEALEEPLAVLCHSTLALAERAVGRQAMELLLLTELKKTFGRLPADLYQRAFTLYQHEIGQLFMIFEPMVRLEQDGPADKVYGYEALARTDHAATQAPVELLNLPRHWGPRFIIERDGILASKALALFSRLHRQANTGHDSPPLSVNVAIRSLVSPAYRDRLRDAIRSARLRGRVTLEISEQDAVELPSGVGPLSDVMAAFRQRLVRLITDLDVTFAIDDFGVGHSSLDRLAALDLAQIKVDQAVLKHPLVLEELKLIAAIAASAIQRSGRKRLVVLEGIDEGIFQRRRTGERSLRLKDFYDSGVDLIQGHLLPHRTVDLRPFDSSVTDKIRDLW